MLPSRYEGFPVALLEAMSQRKACIVTRCSSAIDTLNPDGRVLRVVDSESVAPLAVAVRQLAGDAVGRRGMGQEAAAVAEGYRWERVGPLWDQLLADALRHSVST